VVSDSLRWRNVSVQQIEEEVEVVERKEFRGKSWRLWSISSVCARSLADRGSYSYRYKNDFIEV
jgi:hypothetical protein